MKWALRLNPWKPQEGTWKATSERCMGAGQQWLTACAELLFPPVCLLCAQETSTRQSRICVPCQQKLNTDRALRCPRCAKPLPQYSIRSASGCGSCRDKRWRFDRTIALGIYGDSVRELVLRLKQSRHEALCLATGELLANQIRRELEGKLPDLVAPVPMHWWRKLLRGTNDAELLAESVARQLGIPFRAGLLRCLRPTRKQGTLLPTERKRNIRGAYAVHRRAKVSGAHVLVVDDVMTTGATANELAKVLRRAGAPEVSIAVVARGIGFD